MSVALIEPFDRWFLSLSKGSGTTRRNDCYTKYGGFDKLNHRNANLLDSPFLHVRFVSLRHCSDSPLGVGTNPERICPIYTFALKACATARLSRSLFFFMSSVQFVVDVLPVYAFFIHKNANKIQQIRCFPDNFVLSVGFADFFSFFFNLFANTLSV